MVSYQFQFLEIMAHTPTMEQFLHQFFSCVYKNIFCWMNTLKCVQISTSLKSAAIILMLKSTTSLFQRPEKRICFFWLQLSMIKNAKIKTILITDPSNWNYPKKAWDAFYRLKHWLSIDYLNSKFSRKLQIMP